MRKKSPAHWGIAINFPSRLSAGFSFTRSALSAVLILFASSVFALPPSAQSLASASQFYRQPPSGALHAQNAFHRNSARRAAANTQRTFIAADRLTFHDRFHLYVGSFTKPDSLLAPAFGAVVGQARNEPPEWGQGGDALAVRFASGYGRLVVGRSIRFAVAAADGEDPRSDVSNLPDFWPRVRYAVIHTFIARNQSGMEMPAFSRFAGEYGAAFVANAWYPPSRANTSHALRRGTYSLCATVGWNVFREFWPDIEKHIFKRTQ